LFENWVNPFVEEEQLVSISTARTAPPEDLLRTHEVGEEAYSKFKSERLDTNKIPFHDRNTSRPTCIFFSQ
jgi:hypothetical protein